MFNENTLKEMETIDMMVSEKTEKLYRSKSGLFLSWTFPINHIHRKQSVSANYFVVYSGRTGYSKLSMIGFGRICDIEKMLNDFSEKELLDIVKRPDVDSGKEEFKKNFEVYKRKMEERKNQKQLKTKTK